MTSQQEFHSAPEMGVWTAVARCRCGCGRAVTAGRAFVDALHQLTWTVAGGTRASCLLAAGADDAAPGGMDDPLALPDVDYTGACVLHSEPAPGAGLGTAAPRGRTDLGTEIV